MPAAASPAPTDRIVPLSPKMVGLPFQTAARVAGIEQVTGHSGRAGLASEARSLGASTADAMLAEVGEDGRGRGALLGGSR